ncbi:class III lanthionine synthetase LanKC [Streptomyces sp. NPDC058284]|uniref:class III lanthionine synthetase LanKC n=1 Tax=unclassified Streptomyces TaxID=2593676 RepID=UPI00364E3810
MYLTYLQFCHPASDFYEERNIEDPGTFFGLHQAPAPKGWTREVRTEWVMYFPSAPPLPAVAPKTAPMRLQGWKIHVSATLDNAEELLGDVSAYCLERSLPFKALSSPHTLTRRNSKYADRGGSGKFITVYPPSDEVLTTALRELDERVGGREGPAILSDLRFREGPLYTRYGAFVSRRVTDASGRRIECIEDPHGNLVPDERRPGFHPPTWAPVPAVLEESLALRAGRRLSGFPYQVRRAIHFSNGGGVYLAERTDTPGRTILLKEARPYCGLDESGRDAVARLEREHEALLGLAGLPGVPSVDAYVDGVEHKFLGRAYVEGRSLMDLAYARNPLTNPDSVLTPREYALWVGDLLDGVARSVAAMHERGWVFGDLHPNNLIVDADEQVHFIDFENASRDVTGHTQTMGVFGFRAPPGHRGTAVDRFALGAMRLALLVPLVRLLSLGPGRVAGLTAAARERFDVPAPYFDGLEEQLGWKAEATQSPVTSERPGVADPFTGTALAARMCEWRTPERQDRLFPGDVRQFLHPAGGLGLAYGAAGVLWSLHRAGRAPDPADLSWLRERVRAAADLPPGFWNGLAGIAFATESLDPAFSDECLERALRAARTTEDLSLAGGLSGLGVQLLRAPGHRDEVAALIDRVVKAVDSQGDPPGAGLVDGAAGLSVFLLRAAAALDDGAAADMAGDLLDLETRRFGLTPDTPVVQAALPARGTGLATGVTGLALAYHDHIRLSGQDRFSPPLERVVRIARQTTALHNGLLNGRAGLVQFLTAVAPDDLASAVAVRRALTETTWHVAPAGKGLVPLGDESLKLSLDLGTGLAGLVLTHQAAARRSCTLPLWEGPR